MTALQRELGRLYARLKALESWRAAHATHERGGNPFLPFMQLPACRAWWSVSSYFSSTLYDQSPQARNLTQQGSNVALFTYNNHLPYFNFGGTDAYFTRADESALDITGALTWGGWFKISVAPGAGLSMVLMAKSDVANQRAFELRVSNAAMTPNLVITTGGSSATATTVSGTNLVLSEWSFVVGRYLPSTSLGIYVNGVWTLNTTSIPASIFNSSAALSIAAYSSGASPLNGQFALGFLCANDANSLSLTDAMIDHLYHASRWAFAA